MSTAKSLLSGRRLLLLLIGGIALLLIVFLGAQAADLLRPPQAVYREAQGAQAHRAIVLYERLAEQMPQIEEYFRLEAARVSMPSVEAVNTLGAIITARPHSPAAYEAHLILARHYAASGEVAAAEAAYRAALALEEAVALRLELARYLAEVGRLADAYREFQVLLRDQRDAFTGMRRYGEDPLKVAADLNAATYFSDALETLRELVDDGAALLRAQALAGLGQYEQAAEQYLVWLALEPDDAAGQLGLAAALEALGRPEEALAIYRSLDDPAARLAEADLLADDDPETALGLYWPSQDPIAWWKATTILEETGRQAEALPLYRQVAEAGVYLADDAAYRMLVLAQRENAAGIEREARQLLAEQGLTYLGLQAQGGQLSLPLAPPYDSVPSRIVEKSEALEQLGLSEMARRELIMAARFDPRPEAVAAAAQALAERGYVGEAQAIAQRLLSENPRRPLIVWRLAYPKPYSAYVLAAAEVSGVDPLLVWAVMREESRFDPEALSYANAQGLMQVIPSTRDWIAGEIGEEVRPDAMFDPETGVRYGTWYLGTLLRGFDEDVELAVTAYNGGPGSVSAWLDEPMVESRDDFYRWIGFGQTREYLSRVMLSFHVYQRLEAPEAF